MSPEATRALAALKRALPAREFDAVGLWLETFFPYQREWLLDLNRFSLILKARQIGASHTESAASVLWGLLGDTTTIISIGEREAIEVLDKARKHATVLERLGSLWARSKPTTTQVRLASGGRILALPSTSGGRSYSGNVILDEIAYYQRPKEIWDGAAGTVLHGYRLRALSTPNGVGNFWHGLWTDPRQHEGYRKHSVTLEQAKADGLRVNDDECWRMARGDPRVYDQLFRCSFIDGEQQYIPTEAIEACSVDDTYCYSGVCTAGLDLGRTNDNTALAIVRQDELGILWNQFNDACKRTEFSDVERLARIAFSPPWNCRRLCVDSTGIGAFPAEQLQKRHGRMRVEPVTFTLQSKEELATTLFSAFVERRIRIPKSDTQLRDDLCSIRRIVTAAGNVRYDAPVTDAGHADRAWALALAVHAASGPDRRRHEVYGDAEPETTITMR